MLSRTSSKDTIALQESATLPGPWQPPGLVLRVTQAQAPKEVHDSALPPMALVGDPKTWGDGEFRVNFLLVNNGGLLVGLRVDETSADLPGVWFSLAASGQWNITSVAPGALSPGAALHTGVLPNTTAPLTPSVWYTFRAISYGKVMAFKIDRTPAACFHSCGPSSFFVHFNATGAEQQSLCQRHFE